MYCNLKFKILFSPRNQRRSRSRTREPIDKKRLLEIARKNAISMIKKGALPRSMTESSREKLMEKIKHGGNFTNSYI